MVFENILDEYFRFNDLSPVTIIRYREVVHTFEKDTGISRCDILNEDDVVLWKEEVLGRAKPATWNNYRRHMRALMNFAIKRGYAKINPFVDVKPAIELHLTPKYCTTAEITQVLKALDDDVYYPGWFWKTVVRTFYYTGMRRRQLCGLIWSDFDYPNKQILLRAEHSKTKRQWYVPLDDRLIPEVITLYQRSVTLNPSLSPSNQVFNIPLFNSAYKSDKLVGEQITQVFKRIGQKLGIPFSPHMIRHNFGTQTGKGITTHGSMDLYTLKNQMGHTNLSTTIRYISPCIDPQRTIVKKLEDI